MSNERERERNLLFLIGSITKFNLTSREREKKYFIGWKKQLTMIGAKQNFTCHTCLLFNLITIV
jgi:hypothetical protein